MAMTACSDHPVGSTPQTSAAQLHAGAQCAGQGHDPKATWITDEARFRRAYANMYGHALGMRLPEPPAVEFKHESVLLLAMGQRPTAGYQLALDRRPLRIDENAAVVRVLWMEPAPGSVQAQVLTSPCAMFKLPRAGYGRVRVVDQNGQARFDLPAP